MPTRAPHPCSNPTCGELVPYRGQCPIHGVDLGVRRQRQADRRRSAPSQQIYVTARWKRRRASFLARYPTCADCGRKATVPDHDPYERAYLVAIGVADPDADEYLQPRCAPCHGRRTALTRPGGWNRTDR